MHSIGAANSNRTHVIIPYPAAAAAARSSTGSNYTATTDQHAHLKYAYGPPATSQKHMRLLTDESKRFPSKGGNACGGEDSSSTLEPHTSVYTAANPVTVGVAQVSSARLPPVSNVSGGASTHATGSSTILPDINKRGHGHEKEEAPAPP